MRQKRGNSSFYDSNPNVLVEAASYSCNIICSNNIGNSLFVNKNCIVNNFRDYNSWINIIESCNKSYAFKGFNKKMVKDDLINLFEISMNNYSKIDSIKMDAVGIYKIPSLWNEIKDYSKYKGKPLYFKNKTSIIKILENMPVEKQTLQKIYILTFLRR